MTEGWNICRKRSLRVMAMIEDMDRKSRGAEGMVLNVCLFDGNLHKEIKT